MSTYSYKVSGNSLLTSTVRSVRLTPDDGQNPLLFEPGQYASLSLRDTWRPSMARCFSIASSPLDKTELEFAARVGGSYTNALERLTVGDKVEVRGPFGQFVLREQTQPSLVFLAGGIGITPFMSMMRYATDFGLPNRLHLVYSCRSQDDIPFVEELMALERRNRNIRVTYVIAGGDTSRLRGARVLMGQLGQEHLRTLGLEPARDTFMICGPGPYIKAMQELLASHGVASERILSESFTQGTKHASSTLVRWPANAYALSGLSLLMFGSYVVASDLSNTLPKLEASYQPSNDVPVLVLGGSDGSSATKIEDIPPQVDTTITREPIIERVIVEDLPAPSAPASTPAPTPAPKPTPTPTPAPVPDSCSDSCHMYQLHVYKLEHL